MACVFQKTSFRRRLVGCSILSVVALAVSPAAGAQLLSDASEVGMSPERLARIATVMQRYVDEGRLPGVITIVARRGKVVHFEVIGSRNIETGEPMTRDTIFRLYSQTKPVTAVAVMLLYEEGRLLLNDPVAKYLPEFAEMEVYVGEKNGRILTEPARPMTIQHLLTHTSGLTYDWYPTAVSRMYADAVIGADGSRQESLEAWTRRLAELPLIAQPGTVWNYGASFDVLGRLIEVISG